MNKVYGIQLAAAFIACAIFMTSFEGSQAGSFGLVLGPTIVWIGYVVWEIRKQSWSKEVQNKALLTMVYLAISGYIGQGFYLDQINTLVLLIGVGLSLSQIILLGKNFMQIMNMK